MKTGYELLLPSGILEYFEVVGTEEYPDHIILLLDEKNNPPCEKSTVLSKGFYPSTDIKDFPVRGKGLLLRIRRRRWQDKQTGLPVIRDWALIAKGTHLTNEFAAFLKGIPG